MKRFGNVYDFNDFKSCLRKTKCIPIIMKPQEFRACQSGVSHHTPNRLPERTKLASMVQVIFWRKKRLLCATRVSLASMSSRSTCLPPSARAWLHCAIPVPSVLVTCVAFQFSYERKHDQLWSILNSDWFHQPLCQHFHKQTGVTIISDKYDVNPLPPFSLTICSLTRIPHQMLSLADKDPRNFMFPPVAVSPVAKNRR
ncbi:hypothetical protein PoB_007151100 [Plakobranchus ocellatus]|uniref:Uncharacterized protein n=1 Tax=Plakobranchus ocellatus TaxID=259542 RepID=A0AAV4DLF7_9GAST|nr:hypothetical protein PoB_007151100 [Plakobranchus ocellatus]